MVPPAHHTCVHVAAAVIVDTRGEVLLSRRHAHAHQGGLWEFPGGKLEAGEDAYAALVRELREELGITVDSARPLIRIPYRYPDKALLLDVWRVTAFRGVAHGREGQPVQWVAPERLPEFAFPAANQAVVTAARLPDRYLITPEPGPDFLERLDNAFAAGMRLLQLRAKALEQTAYTELARTVCTRAAAVHAQVLLNADPALAMALDAAGVHLNVQRLMRLSQRPLPYDRWVAASCHNAEELAQAVRIGCDFVVLGPVQPTASHPNAPHLGWSGLRALCDDTPLPVYALGGLSKFDLTAAWQAGAQGVAAIRAFWPERT